MTEDTRPTDQPPYGLSRGRYDNLRYHPLTPGRGEQHELLRDAVMRVAAVFEQVCPESRQHSTAQTLLEQALQMGNAALAVHDPARQHSYGEGIYMGGHRHQNWPHPGTMAAPATIAMDEANAIADAIRVIGGQTRAEAEGRVDDQGQAVAWADEPTGTGPRRPPVEDVPLNHLSDERPPSGAVEGASMPGGVVDEVEHWRDGAELEPLPIGDAFDVHRDDEAQEVDDGDRARRGDAEEVLDGHIAGDDVDEGPAYG